MRPIYLQKSLNSMSPFTVRLLVNQLGIIWSFTRSKIAIYSLEFIRGQRQLIDELFHAWKESDRANNNQRQQTYLYMNSDLWFYLLIAFRDK